MVQGRAFRVDAKSFFLSVVFGKGFFEWKEGFFPSGVPDDGSGGLEFHQGKSTGNEESPQKLAQQVRLFRFRTINRDQRES